MADRTTVIRNADWAIAWDAEADSHVYLRGVDIVFAGDEIVHVGRGWQGEADESVDGSRLLAMPGFVDIHAHPGSENIGRGVCEEVGTPALYMSGVHEPKPLFLPAHSMAVGHMADPSAGMAAATRIACAELLRSGCTTVVDLGRAREDWCELYDGIGIRAVLGHMYRSARWMPNGHRIDYDWDEAAGERGLAQAVDAVKQANAHSSGRISGLLSPAQVDTCTPELLRDSHAAATELGVPITLHTSQCVWDVLEITRRHGVSPVRWLAEIGVLTERMIVGHGMFLDHHSWVPWSTRDDLGLLAGAGASVAHCPTVMSRYGQIMESFGGYLRAGINMGLGTDTQPHNMLEEMRSATIFARIGGRNIRDLEAGQVFRAATVGGARALGREDLGRLAVGARADVVLVDLEHPAMRPVRDPVRSLMFSAADRAVRHVYVGGRRVVEDGEVLTYDEREAMAALEDLQAQTLATVHERDRLGRGAEEISPLSFPLASQ